MSDWSSASSSDGGRRDGSTSDEESVLSFPGGNGKQRKGSRSHNVDRSSQHEKWVVNRTRRLVVPLKAENVRMARTNGICIRFDKLAGFRLPNAFSETKKSKNKLEYSLHVSFFHMASQNFFGSTWVSSLKPAPKGLSSKKAQKLDLGEFFVSFCTKISDPSCLAVVEVVVVERDSTGSEILGQYGCGWTSLPVFAMIPDLGSSSKPTKRKVQLYSGSPRALLFIVEGDKSSLAEHLKPMEDCTLSFAVSQDNQITKISHLIRLNEMMGPGQIVPGLKPIQGIASFPEKPMATLHLLPTMDLYVNGINILLPVNWEDFAQDYLRQRRGIVLDAEAEGTFSIKIGAHNGRTIISKSGWKETKLAPIDYGGHPDYDRALRFNKPVKVKGLVRDPDVAVACQVEYSVRLGNGSTTTYVVGCAIWLPFAEKGRKMMLSNCPIKTSITKCPLQLKLQTDLQSPFTDNGFFLPLDDGKTRPMIGLQMGLKPQKIKDFDDDDDDSDSGIKNRRKTKSGRRGRDSEEDSEYGNSEGDDFDDEGEDDENVFSPSSSSSSSSDGLGDEFYDRRSSPNKTSRSRRKERNRKASGRDPNALLSTLVNGEVVGEGFSSGVYNTLAQGNDIPESLLAQTLKMKMFDGTNRHSEEEKKSQARGYATFEYEPSSTTKSAPTESRRNNQQVLSSSLTRASRTILNQHGFSSTDAPSGDSTRNAHLRSVPSTAIRGHDIDTELRDKLKSNEVTFQFAAYRTVLDQMNSKKPDCVFFTFQFFNCLPTRTEMMNLRASSADEGKSLSGLSKPYVLMRGGDPRYRNAPSLALKFVVDTTTGGDDEPLEFAKYLQEQTLFIHVWDGESLLCLGTVAFPLCELMRQGEKMVKFAQEYDVIQPSIETNASGVQEIDMYHANPGRGELVGKVQLIATNYGSKGRGPKKPLATKNDGKDTDAVDWRVKASFQQQNQAIANHEHDYNENMGAHQNIGKPSHRVVARPLTQGNRELEDLILVAGSTSRRKLIHPSRRYKDSKNSRMDDDQIALEAEWALSKNELSRLEKALDRANRGQIDVQAFRDYIKLDDLMSRDSSLVWAKIKNSCQLTTESYRRFNDVDTDNVGTVTSGAFKELVREIITEETFVEDELDTLCAQFRDGKDQINYERFLMRVLGNEAGDLESKLRRVLRAAMRNNGVTLKQAFQEHFDSDGDGSIEREELAQGLKALGFHARSSQINLLMQRYGNGEIMRFSDFVALADTEDHHPITRKGTTIEEKVRKIILTAKERGIDIEKTFRHFDKDGNGEITKEECAQGLQEIGLRCSDDEFKELFSKLDVNHDESVQLDEFMAFLLEEEKGSRGDPGSPSSPSRQQARQEQLKQRRIVDQHPLQTKMRKILLRAQEQGIKMEDTFKHFDKDGNGVITASECKQGLKEMGLEVSDEEITDLFKAWDVDGDGTVELSEFIAFVTAEHWENRLRSILERAKSKKIDLKKSFHHFDKKGKGVVSTRDFKSALGDLGFKGSDAEFKLLIRKFDTNNDGSVSYKEFLDFVNGNNDGSKEKGSGKQQFTANQVVERLQTILRTARDRGVDVNKSFAFFDQSHSDEISRKDLKRALQKLGFDLRSDDELDELMSHFDQNHDGTIDLEEFKKFVDHAVGNGEADKGVQNLMAFIDNHAEKLKKKCRRYDRKDDGTVSFSRFVHVIEDLGWEESTSLTDLKGFLVDHDRVQYEKLGSDSVRNKLIKAVDRALKKGINVEDLLLARDRNRVGKLTMLDLHQFVVDLGFSILEERNDMAYHLGTTDDPDTTSRQLAKVNQLRRARTIRSNKYDLYDDIAIEHDDGGEYSKKETEFDIIRRYREGHKRDLIGSLLRSSMTRTIPIYPSFAKPCYFEVLVTNPFPQEERFRIHIQDGELGIVTSGEHWRFLRDHVSPAWKDPHISAEHFSPVEDEMVTPDSFELTLDGNESVSIPFVFVSFASGPVVGTSKYSSSNPAIKERIIPVRITSARHGHTILMLQVNISPKPFVVDRVIHLTGANNEYVKASMRVRDEPYMERFVHCLDANAVVEWRDNGLMLKYRASLDSSGEFHVLIYNDPFHADLHAIWHVVVQPMQRVDCHGVLGQATNKELIVKGDRFSRRVQVFASAPGETELLPSGPFQLVAGAFNRVELIYRPLTQTAPGATKQIRIHMVDVDSHELITAWLVKATAAVPDVTKTFEIQLPLHRASHKKIAYVNPWNEPRIFVVHTSDPIYVKPKQPQIEIPPKSKSYIRLWFAAAHKPVTKQVLIFINDQHDQNEECLLIKANYTLSEK